MEYPSCFLPMYVCEGILGASGMSYVVHIACSFQREYSLVLEDMFCDRTMKPPMLPEVDMNDLVATQCDMSGGSTNMSCNVRPFINLQEPLKRLWPWSLRACSIVLCSHELADCITRSRLLAINLGASEPFGSIASCPEQSYQAEKPMYNDLAHSGRPNSTVTWEKAWWTVPWERRKGRPDLGKHVCPTY